MRFDITPLKMNLIIAGVVVGLFLSVINYLDNRQQDKLIFKTVDLVGETNNHITDLIKSDMNNTTIELNNLQIIMKLAKKLNVEL